MPLTPVPADLVPVFGDGADSQPQVGVAGVELTQGQMAYYDTVTSRWKLASTDTIVHAGRDGLKLVVSHAYAEQPVCLMGDGDVDLGCALLVGHHYVLGANGAIMDYTEIGEDEFVSHIGDATEVDNLELDIDPTGNMFTA